MVGIDQLELSRKKSRIYLTTADGLFGELRDNMRQDIAKWVKNIRESTGFSQNELADKLKINRPAISEIERGNRELSLEEAIKIYYICQVDLKEKRDFLSEQIKFIQKMIEHTKELPLLTKEESDYYNKII